MKNSMNKHEIVINYAINKKVMPMSFLKNDLSLCETSVMAIINDLRKRGLLTYKLMKHNAGKSIEFHLTRSAYYGRS